ncbi:hypothetical protein NJT12_10045 [Flavobacterium sp. AC]|uniref:Uncharacterized protein n=1 Tax=Flavobacterium azizsancarii TaxID=2961580 RepID=A0ABT4WBW7_9FLAO|nr:hypothetical protein [Flavobacterium azizsancarii]MDA6069957.1 hypothetical protein [Flavobacterium azizsancarii]
MDTSYHKNSTATSARASNKKVASKTTSSRSNEKSNIETKKVAQIKK